MFELVKKIGVLSLTLMILPAAIPVAQAQVPDGQALYLILQSRGFDDKSTRALSFAAQLAQAQDLYAKDKRTALQIAQNIQVGPSGLGTNPIEWNEETYLRNRAAALTKKIDGYNFGDTPAASILSLTAGAAIGSLTGGAGFAGAMASGGTGAATSGVLGLFQVNGQSLDPYPVTFIPSLTSGIVERANKSPAYEAALRPYLQKNLDLDLRRPSLSNHPAVINSQLRKDVDRFRVSHDQMDQKLGELAKKQAQILESKFRIKIELRTAASPDARAKLYEERKKLEAEERQFNTYVGSLTTLAQIMGLNEQQMRTVDAFAILTKNLYISTNANGTAGSMDVVNAWLQFALVMYKMMREKKPESPWPALFRSLQQISRQVEQMRQEMLVHFHLLDVNLAQRFRELGSLEAAIIRVQEGHTEELEKLGQQLTRIQSLLVSSTEALASRMRDQLWISCLSLIPPEKNPSATDKREFKMAVDRCARQGVVMALAWSKDPIAVDQPGAEPVQELAATSSEMVISNDRWIPWLALHRGGEKAEPVVNPSTWRTGARLFLNMLQKFPHYMTSLSGSEVQAMLQTGEDIQNFFRTIVVKNKKFDVEFYSRLLSEYEVATLAYLSEMERFSILKQLPLRGPEQRLPGQLGETTNISGMIVSGEDPNAIDPEEARSYSILS